MKPIQGYQEILKAEKDSDEVNKGADKVIDDSNFKNEAIDYLGTLKGDKIGDYSPSEKTASVLAKTDASLANILAAVQSIIKIKPRSKKLTKSKQNSRRKGQKKKSLPKAKKMTSFRILPKKK